MTAILGNVLLVVAGVVRGYPLGQLSPLGMTLSTLLLWLGTLFVLGTALLVSVIFRSVISSVVMTALILYLVLVALPAYSLELYYLWTGGLWMGSISAPAPGVEEAQLADLRALGLDWDGPVVRQSERMALYEEAITRLDADDRLYPCYLYPCYCTRAEIRASASAPHGISSAERYPGTCRELTAAERSEKEASGR